MGDAARIQRKRLVIHTNDRDTARIQQRCSRDTARIQRGCCGDMVRIQQRFSMDTARIR